MLLSALLLCLFSVLLSYYSLPLTSFASVHGLVLISVLGLAAFNLVVIGLKLSSSPVQTTTREPEKKLVQNPYQSLIDQLQEQLLRETDIERHPAGPEGSDSEWIQVLQQKKNEFKLEIHRKATDSFHFRLVVDLEASAPTTFDFLSDVQQRPNWDQLWAETGLVETVSPGTNIYYMRTRPFWPTAAREALVVAFSKKLDENKFMSVSQSIEEHEKFTPRASNVRMQVKMAGQIVTTDSQNRPNMCRLVQIVNGNLNGWIPSSLISMVSTQAFPISMRKVNKLLKALPQKTESDVLLNIEKMQILGDAVPSTEAPMKITKVQSKQMVAGTSPVIQALKFATRVLSRAQPWLVAALFVAYLFNKYKRN